MSNKIWDFINLHNGEEDKQKVLENVTANISFRGSNLWILACAIIIASVGLNVNSTAVIIGAMLISPLMGPILGAGFALGTYNFLLLRKSIKNLLIATIVSLLVSAFYFYISPFKDVQSELLARTSPNIYDVLIAFFGGLVGVIAITRVEKGNPIPGVAIATALMPPLCTAGYGLATFNFSYFFGAFYLYTINCFFICIATFLVIKYLKYPASATIEPKNEKRIRYGITTLMMVMIIPSFYLAYNLFEEKKFTKTVEEFISSEFSSRGYTVIYKKLNYNSKPKKVDIAFLDKKLSKEEMEMYNRLLDERGIHNTTLGFRQDDADLKSEILSELNKQDASLSEKDVTINNLRQELNRYKVSEPGLVKEINVLFPELEDVSLGKIEKYTGTDSARIEWVVLYHLEKGAKETDKTKIKKWLNERLKVDNTLLLQDTQSE
ncbi:DUF389 domain-containing protein [Elizabethkingia anophelis]|jgi:uncharacterized hydrophobic protein (TIGR00271 family)|uniref:FIG00761799: membrane protein n=2 Tax=Bacteroidota TaxID=976 RepID=A0A455ZCX8_9FLAO|nr:MULTISPECIES: DUF389 domain-containing protein [Bacteroidota]MDV3892910.1 DUF389 domain-containing protein [Elizabethkingia anophelis]MDV3916471.1 DUF389 domain-containing protein [Elizabethkingia anophelis]MDV3919406.1 DUF389 domain-containing protein [Elizabethkingia anophelis]MDV3934399.1 DUF389 domain-containing protein [Elizabethkingia anophelis]MDV3958318.1 DUF389 domain-containing protein [Elizabethkingia anophelis]